MKTYLTILLSMLMCSVVHARQVVLEVEVSFNPPSAEYDATEWLLSMDGTQVCTSESLTDSKFECGPFEATEGAHDFTVAVQYVNGATSPSSGVFALNVPPEALELPVPTIIGLDILP